MAFVTLFSKPHHFSRIVSGLLLSYLMASDIPSIPRVAILDDYQGVALSSADWTPLKGRVAIDVFRETTKMVLFAG